MKTANYWIKTILGIFLLTPALISIPLFIMNLFNKEPGSLARLENLGFRWIGRVDYAYGGGGGGFTSGVPFYFGLMAIAGALLLANNSKQ